VRKGVLIVLSCVALGLAGCGSEGVSSPAPRTVIGSLPAATLEPATPAFKLTGNPTAGSSIFKSAGCVNCHTLAAAHSHGTIGPNLNQAQPDYRLATARVTLGKGQMPSFKGQLSDQQIADVASYVVKSTGGNPGTTKP
jgi:sulfite dehydrogenase